VTSGAVNRFPPGWAEARVRDLIAHDESQAEHEAVAEDEAAFEDKSRCST
jgi:cell shape-determining protein MreC